MEISPARASEVDYFLHVLTATDSSVEAVTTAQVHETDDEVRVQVGRMTVTFRKAKVGRDITVEGQSG